LGNRESNKAARQSSKKSLVLNTKRGQGVLVMESDLRVNEMAGSEDKEVQVKPPREKKEEIGLKLEETEETSEIFF
jgi:hypothetical protein